MRSFTTLALGLTLCFILAAPSGLAAEPSPRGLSSRDLLGSLWSFLLPWWGADSMPKAGVFKDDPRSGSQESAPTTEEGMGGTGPVTEEGMTMDPLG